MEIIVNEESLSFKALEQKVYSYICEMGREITRVILEDYDQSIADQRDKKLYRDKGYRTTTIKTIYGEVSYHRRVYQTKLAEGRRAYVYLLDKALHMDKIGLISTNLAEKITLTATEASYRDTAETISNTCGQSISHTGVWNLVQELGERIKAEETYDVKKMEAGKAEGIESIPVLFEEMDGIWLTMQGNDHKREKKQELKIATMYEGWENGQRNIIHRELVNKKVFAGMEKSKEFHAKREAMVEKRYALDGIGQRILNGDGGTWVQEPYDSETIFQLDRYHIYQAILRGIADKTVQHTLRRLLEEKKIKEMLTVLQEYINRLESQGDMDERSQKARELYSYLYSNREGLLPWQERGLSIPSASPGIIYKNMGIQESQNCTVITLRMKHRRARWSVEGANHLAKVLYRKANQELSETIERYTDGGIYSKEIIEEVKTRLRAKRVPAKDGKGSAYIDRIQCHLPMLDVAQTGSRKCFKAAFYD